MEVKIINVPAKLNIEKNAEFRSEIDNAIDADLTHIVLDFSICEFIDSAGLGVLVSSYKKVMQLKGDIKLACLNNQKVFKVFQLTRLDQVFDIYDSLEAALGSF